MAFSRNFYIVFAILVCIAAASGNTVKTYAPPEVEDAPTMREGRFYGGLAGSQASASAFSSAGATGGGYGGYPMGGYGGWGK